MSEFTHFDDKGNARMVDVSEKPATHREASACGTIYLSEEALNAVLGKKVNKGDVLTVAQTAGIMATKRTSELIPMCHSIGLSHAGIEFETDKYNYAIKVTCSVSCVGKTGAEMEALNGATVALLTIYDMCKSIDKRMHIEDVHLVSKSGGKSGEFSY